MVWKTWLERKIINIKWSPKWFVRKQIQNSRISRATIGWNTTPWNISSDKWVMTGQSINTNIGAFLRGYKIFNWKTLYLKPGLTLQGCREDLTIFPNLHLYLRTRVGNVIGKERDVSILGVIIQFQSRWEGKVNYAETGINYAGTFGTTGSADCQIIRLKDTL